ncbi:hypothetical protein C8R44DRAFT_746452 [Mycena epipterygia]|nr:hypothetical protein C8R44DRAFT_746452 [Mycena epipterygia]
MRNASIPSPQTLKSSNNEPWKQQYVSFKDQKHLVFTAPAWTCSEKFDSSSYSSYHYMATSSGYFKQQTCSYDPRSATRRIHVVDVGVAFLIGTTILFCRTLVGHWELLGGLDEVESAGKRGDRASSGVGTSMPHMEQWPWATPPSDMCGPVWQQPPLSVPATPYNLTSPSGLLHCTRPETCSTISLVAGLIGDSQRVRLDFYQEPKGSGWTSTKNPITDISCEGYRSKAATLYYTTFKKFVQDAKDWQNSQNLPYKVALGT